MSEERAKAVRDATEELNMAMYQLSGFAEMLFDIIDEMPFQEEKEDYSLLCHAFCRNEHKKLDILATQLVIRLNESSKLAKALEKEVFAS